MSDDNNIFYFRESQSRSGENALGAGDARGLQANLQAAYGQVSTEEFPSPPLCLVRPCDEVFFKHKEFFDEQIYYEFVSEFLKDKSDTIAVDLIALADLDNRDGLDEGSIHSIEFGRLFVVAGLIDAGYNVDFLVASEEERDFSKGVWSFIRGVLGEMNALPKSLPRQIEPKIPSKVAGQHVSVLVTDDPKSFKELHSAYWAQNNALGSEDLLELRETLLSFLDDQAVGGYSSKNRLLGRVTTFLSRRFLGPKGP